MAGRWVDVGEAARELGISTDAVRKRIARGSLEADRQEGSVLVWLDDGGTKAGREGEVDGGPLVEALRDQVADLRGRLDREQDANRENRRIIAALASRIPELESPAQQPASAESLQEAAQEPAADGPTRPAPGGREPPAASERVSWWRRVFG
jgi:hypothetical protein